MYYRIMHTHAMDMICIELIPLDAKKGPQKFTMTVNDEKDRMVTNDIHVLISSFVKYSDTLST